jgi:hypothetical protein
VAVHALRPGRREGDAGSVGELRAGVCPPSRQPLLMFDKLWPIAQAVSALFKLMGRAARQ